MNDIKKIMAAMAFSEYSQGIFEYSVQLAKALDYELVIGSIINSRDVSAVETVTSMGYEVDGNQYVKEIKKEREDRLQKMIKSSSMPGDKTKIIIRVGHPVDELLKIVVNEDVDAVVMGLKGRTNLEQLFVGSVAEKMFRRCPVPVISYRDGKIARRLRKRVSLK